MAEENRALTSVEAAAFLGSTKATLENWRHKGCGPAYIRQGRSIRYRLADLIAFQESHKITPEAKGMADGEKPLTDNG